MRHITEVPFVYVRSTEIQPTITGIHT